MSEMGNVRAEDVAVSFSEDDERVTLIVNGRGLFDLSSREAERFVLSLAEALRDAGMRRAKRIAAEGLAIIRSMNAKGGVS